MIWFPSLKAGEVPKQIVINYDASDSTLNYAFTELKYFLDKAGVKDIRENVDAGTTNFYLILMKKDAKLKPYTFRVEYPLAK